MGYQTDMYPSFEVLTNNAALTTRRQIFLVNPQYPRLQQPTNNILFYRHIYKPTLRSMSMSMSMSKVNL